ncbi:MAG: serine/threonine protein kinase [Cyanobacteria bacterium HKST-UBA02]|nr:serine/threonine protein kinase [Cyanobacteria bacterium HKST-UBA02]
MTQHEKEDQVHLKVSESASERDPEMVGKTVGGHFEVLSVLGKGGMSTVYKARHILLDRIVAIKFVLPKLVHDEKTIWRFQQEAKAATSLQHPNICGVKEFGLDERGCPFLVMDLIDGQTLKDLIGKRLAEKRIIELARQICAGLEYAHAQGVIHRDLKPENIVVTRDKSGAEEVKILDFGIAKLLRDDEEGPNLTKTGDIFGTPTYMSPEQCLGKRVDRRSDIYSLGCLLYEMAAGKPPFASDSSLEMLMLHVNESPPPLEKLSVTADMEKIIYCCLRKDPDERYQSIKDLASDLEDLDQGLQADIARTTARTWKKEKGQLKLTTKVLWAAIVATAIGVTLAIISTVTGLGTGIGLGGSDYATAGSLDARAYQYFVKGDYEKAAPLLEFGVETYREQVEKDRAEGNNRELPAHEVVLAENYQHIGKCYLFIAQKAEKAGDTAKSREKLEKALERYRQAMEIWKKYGNYRGSMMPEAVAEYARVLEKLGLTDELSALKDLARQQKIAL